MLVTWIPECVLRKKISKISGFQVSEAQPIRNMLQNFLALFSWSEFAVSQFKNKSYNKDSLGADF